MNWRIRLAVLAIASSTLVTVGAVRSVMAQEQPQQGSDMTSNLPSASDLWKWFLLIFGSSEEKKPVSLDDGDGIGKEHSTGTRGS